MLPPTSEARLCSACGVPLAGRRPQAQHCSDRCRAHGARLARQRRIDGLLDSIAAATQALRHELRLRATVSDPPAKPFRLDHGAPREDAEP